jgi:hypothetical protein
MPVLCLRATDAIRGPENSRTNSRTDLVDTMERFRALFLDHIIVGGVSPLKIEN